MKEIDKILAIKNKLTDEKKKEIDIALETINDTFKKCIMEVKDYINENENEKPDTKAAKEALANIKSCAESVNEDFPRFNTDDEVITYILKYGSEIINL